MPGMEGIDVCKNVRERESTISKYLIILTSRNTKEDIAKGLEYGADDYIEKPASAETIIKSLKRLLRL